MFRLRRQQRKRPRAQLYIFDLDQTLTEMWNSIPLPGRLEALKRIARSGVNIAIATNQAGVSFHCEYGRPYPSAREVGQRLQDIADALPPLKKALWLIAIGHSKIQMPPSQKGTLAASVTRATGPLWAMTSAKMSWRKPEPGMLIEACRSFSVQRSEAIFVGDRESDEEAAKRAGIRFIPANNFFGNEEEKWQR